MNCTLNVAPMKLIPIRPLLTVIAIAMVLTVVVVSQLCAGQRVIVRVASGRQFDAEVAERTGDTHLWLAFRTRSAELLRPVSWSSIESAEMNGQSFTGAALREHIMTTPVSFTSQNDEQEQPEQPEQPAEQLPAPAGQSDGTMADEALDALFASPAALPPPIASVRFDAHIANWDADVEADGLIVRAIPVDAHGHVVPAKGHLQVELFAARRIPFQDAPHKRGRRIQRIGRWTEQVLPQCIYADGAWFKLPFQAAHPQFDTAISTGGLVHVRLVAPGSGVFEDSIDGVRIRPFAPLRDDMQQVEGRRFLATERTGRGKRTQP